MNINHLHWKRYVKDRIDIYERIIIFITDGKYKGLCCSFGQAIVDKYKLDDKLVVSNWNRVLSKHLPELAKYEPKQHPEWWWFDGNKSIRLEVLNKCIEDAKQLLIKQQENETTSSN